VARNQGRFGKTAVNFTVIYVPKAEKQLVELWMSHPSRQAVSMAADEIDQRLGTNPTREGESREADLRILHVPPLGVTYRVSQADRVVHILQVWSYRDRP
jgi:hypothetical protein